VLHPVRPVQPVVTLCSPQARRKDAAGRLRSRASVNNRKDSVKLKRPPDQGDTRRSTRLHDAAIHSSSPPLRGPVFKHGAAVKVLPGRGKADAPACGKPRTSPQKKARATVAGAGGGGEGRVRGQDRRLSPRTPRAQKDRAVCLDERWHEHRDQAPCKEKSMHSLQEVTHITLGSSEFRLDKVFSYSRTASVPRPTAVFHLAALKSLHVGSNSRREASLLAPGGTLGWLLGGCTAGNDVHESAKNHSVQFEAYYKQHYRSKPPDEDRRLDRRG